MTHEIIWTFDRDAVSAKGGCDDADCISRYACNDGCEIVYDIRRDESGVSHGLYDHNDEIKLHMRHQMVKGDYCNVVEFLNADAYLIPELSEEAETFEIGRTVIEPVWLGEDGVLWKRPAPQPSDSEGEAGE